MNMFLSKGHAYLMAWAPYFKNSISMFWFCFVFALILGLCLIFMIKFLLSKKNPAVIIDDTGITLLHPPAFGFIPWSAIENVAIVRLHHNNFIGLNLKDITAYKKTLPFRKRFHLDYGYFKKVFHILLPTCLEIPMQEVVDIIKRYI